MDNLIRKAISASDVREVMMGRGYEDYIITSIEIDQTGQLPPEAYIWCYEKIKEKKNEET